MASIGKDKNGAKRILFVAPDGKRRTVRLGKCSMRNAENVKGRIERLLSARITDSALDNDLLHWLKQLIEKSPVVYDRLVAVADGFVVEATGANDRSAANCSAADRAWVLFIDRPGSGGCARWLVG